MSDRDLAVSVRGLSKNYTIAHNTPKSTTLVEAFAHAFRKSLSGPEKETFWALRDLDFDIHKGDVVGVIGRNGAGKSTLLKILSRITEPTTGQIDIYGRVGSLLEVGTGFHPELTGRENIYMNGAILGMSRREISKQFDEIVAFAEVEQFLDTPVKRYSSGMYVRLAFAVAAHLNSEILIVDEVLAVGDAAFQKKCLGKMQNVSRESGKTVLFVSHNIGTIATLCSRALLMINGKLAMDDVTSRVTEFYQQQYLSTINTSSDLTRIDHRGSGKARFTSIAVTIFDRNGDVVTNLYPGCDLQIQTEIVCHQEVIESNVAATIYDANGYRLIDANFGLKHQFINLSPGQKVSATFRLRDLLLKPGTYYLELWFGRTNIEEMDFIESAIALTVCEDPHGERRLDVFPGAYTCRYEATLEDMPADGDSARPREESCLVTGERC